MILAIIECDLKKKKKKEILCWPNFSLALLRFVCVCSDKGEFWKFHNIVSMKIRKCVTMIITAPPRQWKVIYHKNKKTWFHFFVLLRTFWKKNSKLFWVMGKWTWTKKKKKKQISRNGTLEISLKNYFII